MSKKYLTNRKIGNFCIKANWTKIDKIINIIKNNDIDNEIYSIGILKEDVCDETLFNSATIVAISKKTVSYDLCKAINIPSIDYKIIDDIPLDFVEIWKRK